MTLLTIRLLIRKIDIGVVLRSSVLITLTSGVTRLVRSAPELYLLGVAVLT
ncbi:hypothetical protein LINPERHAP2_LOCUS33587 [Linum perenne]